MIPYSNYRKPNSSINPSVSSPYGHVVKRADETADAIAKFEQARQRAGLVSPLPDISDMGPPYDGDNDYNAIMGYIDRERKSLIDQQGKIDLVKQKRDQVQQAIARIQAQRDARLQSNVQQFQQFAEMANPAKAIDDRSLAQRIADHQKDMSALSKENPEAEIPPVDPNFVSPPETGDPPSISMIDGSKLSPQDRKNLEMNVGARSADPNLSPEAVQQRVRDGRASAPAASSPQRDRMARRIGQRDQAKAEVASAPNKSLLEYLFHPTADNNFNYGAAGGIGALGLGGLAYLMSERKNRLRNALLFALLGGGLGVGTKFLADRYGVGMPSAPPKA